MQQKKQGGATKRAARAARKSPVAATMSAEITTEAKPESGHPDAIRTRAYYLYLERGATPGHELDDWLAAEREAQSIQPTA
jgi:hypothetical protein